MFPLPALSLRPWVGTADTEYVGGTSEELSDTVARQAEVSEQSYALACYRGHV